MEATENWVYVLRNKGREWVKGQEPFQYLGNIVVLLQCTYTICAYKTKYLPTPLFSDTAVLRINRPFP